MSVVISFTKVDLPYGWMGNMSPFKVVYYGKEWRTVEALFQALRYESDEIREEIRSEKSPMAAKMIAKKHRSKMVIDPMSENDVENMRMCLRLKIDQNPILKSKLLITKEFEIIEDIGNRNGERHLFWGAKKVNGVWEGKNRMGKLWMELREEIRSENEKK